MLSAFVLSSSCHKKSEEEALIDFVNMLGRLAEDKNIEAMMAYFADDFSDFEGRTKTGVRSLLESYYSGRTGIVIHILSTKIETLEAGQATIQTEVAVSSGGAEALRRLVKVSPDNYRIRAELVRAEEAWQIHYAEWTSVELSELFPESLSLLKKIFPHL
jgi:hypothetical protein